MEERINAVCHIQIAFSPGVTAKEMLPLLFVFFAMAGHPFELAVIFFSEAIVSKKGDIPIPSSDFRRLIGPF